MQRTCDRKKKCIIKDERMLKEARTDSKEEGEELDERAR